MRDNYVNNVEEILSANQSQRNKIQFLQRERLKRDHYLSDLQENLALNKETLKQYNLMGCNEKAINKLIKQTDILANKLKDYYQEYQNINALLLMEKQMRLQDKQFYQQRIIEFQNKMIDLRKYLHDKQESFTSVIVRLKRYQQMSQATTDDKLYAYKKEIGQKSVSQFLADLIREKNYYKNQYEKMKKDYIVFSDMKYTIINKYEDVQAILKNFQKENSVQINKLVGNIYQKIEEDKKVNKKVEPNKELIRLLKKEKLNNQLLQQALNDAIEKNEELIALKDIYQKSAQKLEIKCRLLYSENTIFALRLAEYDQHYCRKYTHNKRYYELGEKKGLSFITNERLKEYARNILRYYEDNAKLYQQFNEKLKADVDKWGQFLCDAQKTNDSFLKQKTLIKSCSTPKMITGFELDDQATDKLIIEEL